VLLGIASTSIEYRRAVDAERLATQRREDAEKAQQIAIEEKAIAQAAEREAAAQKAHAQREAKHAKAMLTFVRDKVFATTRPLGVTGGLGTNVTVRDAVRASLPWINETFQDMPDAEIELRSSLANTFYQMTEVQDAYTQAETAWLRMVELGIDPNTDRGRENRDMRANTLEGLGHHELVRDLRQKLYDDMCVRPGPSHRKTLLLQMRLGTALASLTRYDESLVQFEAALAGMRAIAGPDDPDTHLITINMCNVYLITGRTAGVAELLEPAHKSLIAAKGPTAPMTIVGSINLASVYSRQGQPGRGIHLLRPMLPQIQAIYGESSYWTIQSTIMLGECLLNDGDPAGTIECIAPLLPRIQAKYSRNHPLSIKAGGRLIDAYEKLGQYALALPICLEQLHLYEVGQGPLAKILWKERARHVHLLLSLNRRTEAEATAQRYFVSAGWHAARLNEDYLAELYGVRVHYHAKTGDPVAARTLAAAWSQRRYSTVDSMYNSACYHAIAGLAFRKVGQNADADAELAIALDWFGKSCVA
ncbi:MAG: hypothetical protein ACRCZF_20130, partial [Gemmataceae bacterium]